MELTLKEAAQRLGRSIRQIRYLIDQGRIEARKRGGVWFVDLATLRDAEGATDAAAGHTQADERRRARLRDAVDEVLDQAQPARRYSLRDLNAFQIARPLYAEVRANLGDDHGATVALRAALDRGSGRPVRPVLRVAVARAAPEPLGTTVGRPSAGWPRGPDETGGDPGAPPTARVRCPASGQAQGHIPQSLPQRCLCAR